MRSIHDDYESLVFLYTFNDSTYGLFQYFRFGFFALVETRFNDEFQYMNNNRSSMYSILFLYTFVHSNKHWNNGTATATTNSSQMNMANDVYLFNFK